MSVEHNHQSMNTQHSQHDFAKALPAFDKAVRQLAEVTKAELERRLKAERAAKAAKK